LTKSSLARPVIADLSTLLDLVDSRVAAHWAPHLRLELAGCNIIADIVVVCASQYGRFPHTSTSLTAEEAARPLHLAGGTVADRAADARRVAPHHLGEVAPGRVVVGAVVRVLGLLLVPAVGGGASELDPGLVAIGSGVLGREIAAGAHLWRQSVK